MAHPQTCPSKAQGACPPGVKNDGPGQSRSWTLQKDRRN